MYRNVSSGADQRRRSARRKARRAGDVAVHWLTYAFHRPGACHAAVQPPSSGEGHRVSAVRKKGPLQGLASALRESPALWWSFLYFFCLLSGYYVLRPVREAMAASADLETVFPPC